MDGLAKAVGGGVPGGGGVHGGNVLQELSGQQLAGLRM
jgi:hypothetical protein